MISKFVNSKLLIKKAKYLQICTKENKNLIYDISGNILIIRKVNLNRRNRFKISLIYKSKLLNQSKL